MKFILTSLAIFFVPMALFSQFKFGFLNEHHRHMERYDKDTTANAVVLYEKGDFKFQLFNRNIYLIKEYQVELKILNEQGFEHATVSIPYYHTEDRTEKVYDIKGMTHNGVSKTGLLASEIFTTDENENWSYKKFTLPNVKEGAIIQYTYKIKSPFFFNLDGWNFQSEIPKLYSEFNAEIPGNYYYNRSLFGSLPLSTKVNEIKNRCFNVGYGYPVVDCEVITYAMKDVPAFDKSESYMLAPSNYMARLEFELATHYRYDGTKKQYTKSWDAVDREFKKDKDIGRQLAKNYFFSKQLPEHLFTEGDALTKAKNIYAFVKDHFTWNGKFGIYKDIRVKQAFNEGTGNIGEINISLINLLKAAGISTNLMLLSTRKNGLAKKSQPVISDFNYVIAKVNIDGKDYLLDATDKRMPFGILPFRCLNHYGRVMDFKEDSYWYDIKAEKKNKILIRGNAEIDVANGTVSGKFREINEGYMAIGKYRHLASLEESQYLEAMESNSGADVSIDNYVFELNRSNDKRSVQSYSFTIENQTAGDKLYLNPFLVPFFEKNPFLKQQRSFPVDFGYARTYEYGMTFKVPENYALEELPEGRKIVLPNNGGSLEFQCAAGNGTVNVRYLLVINRVYHEVEHYPLLKELYSQAVSLQKNTLLRFRRI
ncbi:hypothetical protein ABV409_12725 [Flagellimonas sp. DF-77]|uniref:hypothetical protein n=1 Tax=Flagellimonas algarum TaxID=3230298 RepID=UPI003395A2AD